jgi:endonuclease YncB( thermonuclease family)
MLRVALFVLLYAMSGAVVWCGDSPPSDVPELLQRPDDQTESAFERYRAARASELRDWRERTGINTLQVQQPVRLAGPSAVTLNSGKQLEGITGIEIGPSDRVVMVLMGNASVASIPVRDFPPDFLNRWGFDHAEALRRAQIADAAMRQRMVKAEQDAAKAEVDFWFAESAIYHRLFPDLSDEMAKALGSGTAYEAASSGFLARASQRYLEKWGFARVDIPGGAGCLVATRVKRIIDGDTLEVTSPKYGSVRLMWIDAPESRGSAHGKAQPEGVWAKEWLATALPQGTQILLWGPGRELERDKYDRPLAVVFVPQGEDGFPEILQWHIVRRGWSPAWRKYGPVDIRFRKMMAEATSLARSEKVGVWATDPQYMIDKANETTAPKK